ncbi:EamA family transporter RarD [Cytobacillus sp. NCCP-133]|uniref:EamA family transporter RarD n=1 Tax=Cytobacillus sp. NCCP-133 TaxID=766848 RepID=UPI0022305AB9|nr:EamA family transporter RarD [Cytobacillus sp. NCCP-133]GLB58511.1 transporter [Cytobacillus sp. NCCP-133]
MKKNEVQMGALYAGVAYFLWGILPIYWKYLSPVSADEILANRVFWSFFFMLFILMATRKWNSFVTILKGFRTNRKQLYALIIASLLISTNWFLYIWAVNTDQMIEASLGYYINPLVSVLLGMMVFNEKLSPAQYASFGLAFVGVMILTISYGRFPWIAIVLALSFGLYGLAKKLIKVDSAIGLTLETLMVTPIAFIYMVILFVREKQAFLHVSASIDFLLIGAGAATAIPLLYFAKGAQKIPMSMLGFLQYIAPTLTLILGVFVYSEHFTKLHLLSFMFIWLALTIYSISRTKLFVHWEAKWKRSRGIGI